MSGEATAGDATVAQSPKPPTRAHKIRFATGEADHLHFDLVGFGKVPREVVHAWARRGLVEIDKSRKPWVVRPGGDSER